MGKSEQDGSVCNGRGQSFGRDWQPLSPRPRTRGRGVGGEGAELAEAEPLTPDPSPLSTGARGEGDDRVCNAGDYSQG
jgi:hypothetical protein